MSLSNMRKNSRPTFVKFLFWHGRYSAKRHVTPKTICRFGWAGKLWVPTWHTFRTRSGISIRNDKNWNNFSLKSFKNIFFRKNKTKDDVFGREKSCMEFASRSLRVASVEPQKATKLLRSVFKKWIMTILVGAVWPGTNAINWFCSNTVYG